ncbi:DUF488 domain-containing protein [Desertibaculum subflavum]|uniref:DUF488 domain-containing protein n=1 Tax=Desertibaculum subflavum TaxID=2268458 RepID=UPI000E65FFF9
MAKHPVHLKRVYEPPAEDDGFRVLVDRVWPRGVSKQAAAVDLWMKDIGPSTALRQWFGHQPERWPEFRQRYLAELRNRAEDIATLRQHARRGRLTLVYGARDTERNQAVVLKEVLTGD